LHAISFEEKTIGTVFDISVSICLEIDTFDNIKDGYIMTEM